MNVAASTHSVQTYGTPFEFLEAVEARFGLIGVDLAASSENAVHEDFLCEADASLSVPWAGLTAANMWLNPPFKRIKPWARKCATESAKGARILFLVPASVGCGWFWDHVHGNALVCAVAPRLVFNGTPVNPKTGRPDPFPKDLMLCAFGWPAGFERWAWRGKLGR